MSKGFEVLPGIEPLVPIGADVFLECQELVGVGSGRPLKTIRTVVEDNGHFRPPPENIDRRSIQAVNRLHEVLRPLVEELFDIGIEGEKNLGFYHQTASKESPMWHVDNHLKGKVILLGSDVLPTQSAIGEVPVGSTVASAWREACDIYDPLTPITQKFGANQRLHEAVATELAGNGSRLTIEDAPLGSLTLIPRLAVHRAPRLDEGASRSVIHIEQAMAPRPESILL